MTEANFTMKVTFYGTRGSIPVCSRSYQDFGGNTSCICITVPNKEIVNIIDAGSGIRNLGKDLIESEDGLPKEITIGFSHFHWDHIQGFPFFKPAYNPNVQINLLLMGEGWDLRRFKKIMIDQMGGEFFPIEMGDMGARFNYLTLGRKVVQRSSGICVTARLHNHPGGAYSFRLEREGKVLVIVNDIEHGSDIDEGTVALARNADLLIHEAQYTTEQLQNRIGWGHSSYEQAIEVAKRAGAKHLIMTHHDPEHDDHFLSEIEKKCQKFFPDCELAREKMVFTI
jgi:ribonuclease BN (tRNA processing enzyme)